MLGPEMAGKTLYVSENWNNWKDSLNFDELAAGVVAAGVIAEEDD